MAYNGIKTRTWDKTTPEDGDLFEAEFNRIYENTERLKDGTAFPSGSINGNKITDNSITNSKLTNDSISSNNIQNNSITESKLLNNSVVSNKIADGSITNSKLMDNSVATNNIQNNSITESKLLNNSVSESKLSTSLFSKFNGMKQLGEIFTMSSIVSPSVTFPAYCLSRQDGFIWKSSNPGGLGNIPGNWLELVDHLRGLKLIYDPFGNNLSQFTITGWSFAGTTITVTFSYSASPTTKESLILRALHEDAFVHTANTTIGADYSSFVNVTSFRTITLDDPLRNTSDVVQVPAGTYQITSVAGGNNSAGQIKFIHSATPSGTPKTENRLCSFYYHRVQDSGANIDANASIKAIHFAINGRGFVTPSAVDGRFIASLRIRDFIQGHKHLSYYPSGTWSGIAGPGGAVSYENGNFNSVNTGSPIADSQGVPRLSNITHSPSITSYFYIWGNSYIS
jgi:hypothetical protein